MCMLAAAIFAQNDSRVSKLRTRQYAERAICTSASPDWAGAFAAKRIHLGSCNCACQCIHSTRGDSPKRSFHLRRIRRLWLNFWGGVKQKSDSGRGQACSKFQHDGGLPNMRFIFGISESPITTLSDPRGDHAFTRALLLAGLELPCDAGRLQCRSSTKRGERRGGIASGPEVDAGLLLVGGESAAGLPPALVDVCRARHHGALFGSICRGLFLVSGKELT